MLLLVVFITIVTTSGPHPICAWQCDNPTCELVPTTVCDDPVCMTTCTVGDPILCSQPNCHISCPPNQTSVDSCPMCETICDAPTCPMTHNCTILCEATACSWKPPLRCLVRYPRCELNCERPACETIEVSKSSHITVHTITVLLLLVLIT